MAQQAASTGPKYRRIVEDLRVKIENGEYPPGSRLPTKAELMAQYQVAVNTVERAVEELRKAGLVETAQGAGMFVLDRPSDSALPSSDAAGRLEEMESEIASLRRDLSLLQAQVINLYHSTGQTYPHEAGSPEQGRRVG
jgi:DNA-binding GntR family transcriptional regulator